MNRLGFVSAAHVCYFCKQTTVKRKKAKEKCKCCFFERRKAVVVCLALNEYLHGRSSKYKLSSLNNMR